MDSDDVFGRYLRRNPEADAAYDVSPHYRLDMIGARHLLRIADDAMDAEGIPEATRERVLRAVIYGTPNPDDALDAEQRRRSEIGAAMNAPPPPLLVPHEVAQKLRYGSWPDG